MKQYKILIADDEELIRNLIQRLCESMGWTVSLAEDGNQALELLNKDHYQIFILDVNMPGPSGIELARKILTQEKTAAVLIITGFAEVDHAVQAMREGIFDYIQKDTLDLDVLRHTLKHAASFHDNKKWSYQINREREKSFKDIDTANKQFKSILELSNDLIFTMDASTGKIIDCNVSSCERLGYTYQEMLSLEFQEICQDVSKENWNDMVRWGRVQRKQIYRWNFHDREGNSFPAEASLASVRLNDRDYLAAIARDISSRIKLENERQQYFDRIQETLVQTIKMVALTVEKRDPYTAGHQTRVATLAKHIAEQMNIESNHVEGIYMGGIIHDIGKIAIPAEILSKPGRLLKEEFDLIKTHPQAGFEIVKDVTFPWPIEKMIRQHHERLNGTGYPEGLQGDEIIIDAKILAVADVVEAMATHRPYRPALGIEKSLEEIQKNKGIFYDPGVVDACMQVFQDTQFSFE